MLFKLFYLHGIYYNVIWQDPNYDTYFNTTNILIEKWQKIPYNAFGGSVEVELAMIHMFARCYLANP
jgi:hypothetical protein